jgi:D-alanine-D-alanine ligase
MKRIAVLRGGPSEEYDVSMLTGQAVLEALAASDYRPKDIMISRAGQWFDQGRKRTPDQALEGVDVVFIALHGSFGEDGQVQRILERKRIPFTGSRSLTSGIALNKELTKQTMRMSGVQTPKHRRLGQMEKSTIKRELEQIIIDLGTELYIKPLRCRLPATYRTTSEAHELEKILVEMLDVYDDLLIEQTVKGTAAQVGVLSDFRGEQLYAFPANEIISGHIQPGRFSEVAKQELSRLAKHAHESLRCDQYSLIDFIVDNDQVIFLKLDTHPELYTDANFSFAADSIGLSHRELINHLINTARTT